MSTIGERLKELRGQTTLDVFAKNNGIHRVTLSRLEKGERTPDAEFLKSVIETTSVCSEWILMGTGPMYKADSLCSQDEKVRHVGQNIQDISVQHIENIDMEENKNVRRVGQAGNMDILDRYLRAVDENNALIRENADLRVQAERHLSRIRELERENEELRKMEKRAADTYDKARWDIA